MSLQVSDASKDSGPNFANFCLTDYSLGREKRSHNSYMRKRVIRPEATSAAAQSMSKLNHAFPEKGETEAFHRPPARSAQ